MIGDLNVAVRGGVVADAELASSGVEEGVPSASGVAAGGLGEAVRLETELAPDAHDANTATRPMDQRESRIEAGIERPSSE